MRNCINNLSRIMKLPDEIMNDQEKKALYEKIKGIKNDPDFKKAEALAKSYSDDLKKRNAAYYKSKLISKKKFEEIKPQIDEHKSKKRFMRDFLEKARNHIDTTKNVIVSDYLDSINALGNDGAEWARDPKNFDTVLDSLDKFLNDPSAEIDTNSFSDKFAKLYIDKVRINYENGRALGLVGGKLKDHMVIQSHDPEKMMSPFESRLTSIKERSKLFASGIKPSVIAQSLRDKAEKLWIDTILPRLDHDRTFGDEITTNEQKIDFLKDVYKNITLGKIDDGSISVGSNGSHRVLHFKDKKSWFEYHNIYGNGDLFETMLHTVESGAKKIGVAESFGPRAKELYTRVRNYAFDSQKKHSAKHFENAYDARFNSLVSSGDKPEETLFTRMLDVVKAEQMMSSLGFSGISSMQDISFFLNRAANTGMPYFERLGHILKSINPISDTSADRRALSDMHFLFKDAPMHFQNEFGSASLKQWPKMMMKYFKFNIQGPLDRWLRTMTAQAYAGPVYNMLSKNYEDLIDGDKELLGSYGMGKEEFDLMKKNKDKFRVLKRGGYVTPDGIDKISDQDIKDYAGKNLSDDEIQFTKSKLKRNIASMYYDNAGYVQVAPDDFDKSIVGINNIKSPNLRAATNSLMMFKWFGFSSLRKTLYDIYMSKTTDDLLPSMFNADLSAHGRMIAYLGSSALMGMASDMAIQFLKTGNLENPADHPYRFLLYSLSAPLGLINSVVTSFSGDNEFDPLSLAGPMVSNVKDAGNLLKTIATFDSDGKRLNYHDRVLKSLLLYTDRHVIPHLAWTNQLYYNHVFNPMMNKVDHDYLNRKYHKEQKENPNPLYKSKFFGVNY